MNKRLEKIIDEINKISKEKLGIYNEDAAKLIFIAGAKAHRDSTRIKESKFGTRIDSGWYDGVDDARAEQKEKSKKFFKSIK